LIAGLGNSLLTDDGVGVHAVRLISDDPYLAALPNVTIAEVGVAVLDALPLIEWADIILAVDAMQAGGMPGTIYQARGSDVEDTGLQEGLHELGLLGALHLLPRKTPPPIYVIGIEPEVIDYGLELSTAVQAVLPRVAECVRATIHAWNNSSGEVFPVGCGSN
jgi:hydrogenase maturation protease